DEIVGMGKSTVDNLFGFGDDDVDGTVQEAAPAPLPAVTAQSALPEPSPTPAASSFGAEGEVNVDTTYLRSDAGLWDAASSQYSTITSAAEGLDIDTAAFSFIGGEAASAYKTFQATMVQLLGTA